MDFFVNTAHSAQNQRIEQLSNDVQKVIAKKSVLIVDDYLDFGTASEKLFHCGASSKDAGNKITTIMQLEDIAVYRPLFEKLLQDEK